MQHKDFDYKECNDLISIEASIIAPEISHFEPPIIQTLRPILATSIFS